MRHRLCLVVLGVLFFAATAQAQRAPRIDLSVRDADVRDVLRLLADVGRVNIVCGDEVQGSVTVQFSQVPWEDALRAILQTKGLEMERTGRIIRVASADAMRRERQARIDARRSCLETAPLHTRFLHPSYADAAHVAELIRGRLSPRGSVAIDERTNTLIVRDVECP